MGTIRIGFLLGIDVVKICPTVLKYTNPVEDAAFAPVIAIPLVSDFVCLSLFNFYVLTVSFSFPALQIKNIFPITMLSTKNCPEGEVGQQQSHLARPDFTPHTISPDPTTPPPLQQT